MQKKVISLTTLLALLLLHASTLAGPPAGTWTLGVRMGLFTNSEDDIEFSSGESQVTLFANKTNFYLEGFVNYYFTSYFAAVGNFGTYSKGDIRYDGYVVGYGNASFLGSASIFPVQLGARLSPFTNQFPLKAKPYFEGGGALVIGRETVAGAYYDPFLGQFTDGTLNTETDWTWWFGGGAEIPLSPKIHIDLMGKYISNQFSGDIAGIQDFTGFQASIGVSYHYLK